ncbi:amidohydrolase family protein [Thermoproteota archaeon]
MIIDFHSHIGEDIHGESYSLEQLYNDMEETGITRSVVFPFNCPDEQLIKDSLYLLEESRKDSRLIPFLRFNPNTMTEDKLTSLLKKGFRGLKLHPKAQDFMPDDHKFFWIYGLAEKLSLPIIFHTKMISGKTSDPERLFEIAETFPNLKIVMGHFFGDVLDIVDKVKRFPNMYVETSIYSRVFRLQETVIKDSFDRLIFGSDSPYDHPEVALLKVLKSDLPKENVDKILYKNALKVLGE